MTSAVVAILLTSPFQASEFAIQPYYVYPADQPMHPEYVTAIKKTIVEVQQWYRTKAGVTFTLLPLKIVKGDDFLTMRAGKNPPEDVVKDLLKQPNWWEAMDKAVGGLKPKQVAWIFSQGGGGFAGANLWGDWTGKGIFGDWVLEPISGVREPKAVHAGYATWQVQGGTPVGTTVHELGHALGLHHPDDYPGKSIMRWHGDYPTTGLLAHEVMILRNSPFFVKGAYDVDAPWLDFENDDTATWGQEVRLRGKGFVEGMEIEVRTIDTKDVEKAMIDPSKLEKSVKLKPRIESPTVCYVTVPEGIGPGFFRAWLKGKRGNICPVNFYPRKA